jgi:membrane-bound ClpP family serine protease
MEVTVLKRIKIATGLHWVLLLILALSVLGFLSFQNAYGFFLAGVTALIALGVYKNKSVGYFAAAAWGLAVYQLAKEGYEFQIIKHYAMVLGLAVIPLALFLHEILARSKHKNAAKSAKKDVDKRNMPL